MSGSQKDNYKLHRSKKGEDGLASKVLKIPPQMIKRDNQGEYIPYCNFSHHRGIIINENTCEQRDCEKHYKLRIE